MCVKDFIYVPLWKSSRYCLIAFAGECGGMTSEGVHIIWLRQDHSSCCANENCRR